MKAGELRHVITIQKPSEGQTLSGAPANTWSDVCTLRAKIEPQGGMEAFGGAVFNPEATHHITTRYYPGLLPSMRIDFNGRLFDILNINNYEERNIWILLQCKEGRTHGIV